MRNILHVEADIKGQRRVPAYTVTQNDSVSIVVTVLDGGSPVNLDEVSTMTIACTRRDGAVVVKDGTQTGPNEVTFDLGTSEIELTGKVDAVIQLYSADGRVSTIKFSFMVTKDPTGDGYVPSEDERTLIEVVLGDGPLTIERAETAAANAESAAEYIDEKKPLIDKFTDEQTSLQAQLDEVARGATNAETSQARVSTTGTAYATLKQRLDTEYEEVTTQLAERASEIDSLDIRKADTEELVGTNKRIDNLILESGGDSNLEVADARVSVTKNKEFEVIGERLEDGEKDFGELTKQLGAVYAVNLMKNGDFSQEEVGFNFNTVGGTEYSIVDGELIITSLSNGSYELYSQVTDAIIGHKYYISERILPNLESDRLTVVNGASGYATTHSSSEYETLSTVVTAENTQFTIRWLQTGRSGDISDNPVKIKKLMLIDLTETFGVGKEPTVEQMDVMLKKFPDQWFIGKEMITDLRSNEKLQNDIKGTNKTITFNEDGTIKKISHVDKNTLKVLRVDTFTFSDDTITEERLLITGEFLTVVHHLDTLETEVI